MSVTPSRTPFNRRKFLRETSALTMGATAALAAGRTQAQSATVADPALLPPNIPPWTRNQGGAFINPPYGLPSRHEARVVRVLPNPVPAFPTASRTPPQSLKPDEVYAVTAFVLRLNGKVDANAEMNAVTLPKVEMPNRKGFKPVID